MPKRITQDRLKELLHYDPYTGIFTWRKPESNRIKPGDRAGWVITKGRRIMNVGGVLSTAAKFAWLYAYGCWPTENVMHINEDKSDCRLANLALSKKWHAQELTVERLRQLVLYDPSTGNFVWAQGRHKELTAGTINDSGYRIINIGGKDYRAHTLAWLYIHERWPANILDHINGDPRDNRIENLREADHADNMANAKKPRTNKSGFKGVSWSADRKLWRAQIKYQGVTRNLGDFETPEEAHAVYCEAAVRLKGKFARTD